MRPDAPDISLEALMTYCEAHSSPISAVLYELERETHLKTLAPQMMTGHLQGQILMLLSALVRPKAILEIGTFTAYGSICLAQGLTAKGILHTIEVNAELAYIIQKYIRKAGLERKIHSHIGDAKTLLPTFKQTFDLIFIDAGKRDNLFYYKYALKHLSPNGLILVDNVLWTGKVLEPEQDKMTRKIDEFNKYVQSDERVEKVMLPIRDGLTVIRWKLRKAKGAS